VAQILEQGKKEKEKLIKETQIELSEYKKEQQSKINTQMDAQLNSAKEEIAQQKRAAIGELKNTVAELSIDIAEKILKKEIENPNQHNSLIMDSVEDLEI
jgi:F-type H+-transporting ATPase subunit b